MKYKINLTEDSVVKYPMHSHKNYEIMLYLEGDGAMRTEGADVPFSPGTVVIVPPDIKHGSVSECGFKNISVEGDFGGYFDFDKVKTFSDNEQKEGAALAKMIYDNRFGNERYLHSLCTAYVCFLMNRFEVSSALQERLDDMIFEISERALDSSVDPVRILSKGGYSEDYIRACFKKRTGKTPNEFLTDIRIKHACFLIDIYKNALPLSEIAEKCGYLDYAYFSKKFKEHTGVSPRVYRNS